MKEALHPPTPSNKVRNVGSLFNSWEMASYPKSLAEGIRRAEKHDFIRTELHRLQRGKNKHRNKYARHMGQTGYEQLKLLNLSEITESAYIRDRKTHLKNMMNNSEETPGAKEPQDFNQGKSTIRDQMQILIKEIDDLEWMAAPDREEMTNTFISELAEKYNEIQNLIGNRLKPDETRHLAIKCLQIIRKIKNDIIRTIHKKKQEIEKVGVFSGLANDDRLVTLFRTLLARK